MLPLVCVCVVWVVFLYVRDAIRGFGFDRHRFRAGTGTGILFTGFPTTTTTKTLPVWVLSVHRARLIILVSSDTFKSAASAAWRSRARRQALSISNVGRRMWYSTVAALYTSVCKSVRLDPHTAPFSYDRFKGFCVSKIFTSPTANLRTATKENWIGSDRRLTAARCWPCRTPRNHPIVQCVGSFFC